MLYVCSELLELPITHVMVRKLSFLAHLLLFHILSINAYAQLPGCAATINTFPYFEGFEISQGAWSNVLGDDFNWTRDSGGTPSANTGPTTGSNSVWYMYIETSGSVATGDQAWLESACFDFTGLTNPKLEFDYHMYGVATGSLNVQITTDGLVWTNIWTLSGNQSNNWFTAPVSLAAYSNQIVGLRFIGTDGSSFTGDIAIDNIEVYDELPMQYVSSAVAQSTSAPIENCATDKDILRVEIVTTGQLNPINASQFILRTDGSTLPLTDIAGIDVYYTGASNVFSTANVFGSSGSAITGVDVLLNGNQTLLEGINYFWVSYDVSLSAIIGDFVDATCNEMIVDGVNHVPTISNPSGNREIIDCARACPTQAPIFVENFETSPLVGVTNPSILSGTGSAISNFNPAFVLSGSSFGWFNVQDGVGPLVIYDRRIENAYVGCETNVSYYVRGQNSSAGAMAKIIVALYDDNNTILATSGDYLLTDAFVQFTHTFTSTTPGIRINVFYNSVGGPGRDLVMEDILISQCCSMPNILPAELISFTSECDQNEIQLEWATASESNNDYFTLERSRDAIHFEQVAKINGQGNSTNVIDYQWTDKNPISGTVYYRLSQTDFDGTREELGLRAAGCEMITSIEVFPNPFEEHVKIRAKSGGVYSITDVSGKLVLRGEFNSGETRVDTSNLSGGTYIINIEHLGKSVREKLTKY